MPEDATGGFEQALESDMERLEAEVKSRREHPEFQALSGAEILRHSIQSVALPGVTPPPPPPPKKTPSGNVFEEPLPDYAATAPADVKLEVEQLLEVAFHEGIAKANSRAAQSSAFVMDTFHDALTGKLYPEFKKRGLVD